MFALPRWFGAASRSSRCSSAKSCRRRLRLEGLETRDLLAAVLISPTAGLVTSEAGGSAVVSVALRDAPTADVVIHLRSTNVKEGVVSTDTLTFTPQNFNTVQSFRVTGVPDGVRDGTKYYEVLSTVQSSDPAYNGLKMPAVHLRNLDSRTLVAGITVTPTRGLVTTESGGTASFTIKLNFQPGAPVFIPIRSSKPSEGLADVSGVTFTPDNWNLPQTVTVTGQPHYVFRGDVPYKIITGPAQSQDRRYNQINPADVFLVNKESNDVSRFDGTYEGSYRGKAMVPGVGLEPVSGSVRFVVAAGVITVLDPGSGTGTISASGGAGFGVAGGTSLDGSTFSGVFHGIRGKHAVKAGGGWHYSAVYSVGSIIANGTWTACRV